MPLGFDVKVQWQLKWSLHRLLNSCSSVRSNWMCATSRMGHRFPQASGGVVANMFVGFCPFSF